MDTHLPPNIIDDFASLKFGPSDLTDILEDSSLSMISPWSIASCAILRFRKLSLFNHEEWTSPQPGVSSTTSEPYLSLDISLVQSSHNAYNEFTFEVRVIKLSLYDKSTFSNTHSFHRLFRNLHQVQTLH